MTVHVGIPTAVSQGKISTFAWGVTTEYKLHEYKLHVTVVYTLHFWAR